MASGKKLRGDFVLFFGGDTKVAFTTVTSVAVANLQGPNFLFEESKEKIEQDIRFTPKKWKFWPKNKSRLHEYRSQSCSYKLPFLRNLKSSSYKK